MVRCSARYVIEDREDSAVVVFCELDAGHAGDHEADTPYDRAWWTERILSMGESVVAWEAAHEAAQWETAGKVVAEVLAERIVALEAGVERIRRLAADSGVSEARAVGAIEEIATSLLAQKAGL